MSENKGKKFSLKEHYSDDDIEYKEWIRVMDANFFDSLPMRKITKTFKVANYNTDIENQILRNMKIEIEWVATDNETDFARNLNHYF